jgi:hypothetical protein
MEVTLVNTIQLVLKSDSFTELAEHLSEREQFVKKL